MKTVFKILPTVSESQSLHIIAETGTEGISFLFYTRDPFKAEGLLVCQYDTHQPVSDAATQLKNMAEDEPVLKQSFSSTHILYNVQESTLIPKHLHNPLVKEDILALLHGSDKQAMVFDENVRGREMVNVYRVAKPVTETLRELFPFSVAFHTDTLLLPQLPVTGSSLHCIIYQHHIKVLLQKEGIIQLVQQFTYNTATDVVYHLLNACSQYEIPPSELQLVLSGMIDEQSNLYKELYKYFLQIEFGKPGDEQQVAEGFDEYPAHFFQHLILLASCV